MSQPNRWFEFEAWCDYMMDYCDKQIKENESFGKIFGINTETEKNIKRFKAQKKLLGIRKKYYQETGDSYAPDTEEVRALKKELYENDDLMKFFYGNKKEANK